MNEVFQDKYRGANGHFDVGGIEWKSARGFTYGNLYKSAVYKKAINANITNHKLLWDKVESEKLYESLFDGYKKRLSIDIDFLPALLRINMANFKLFTENDLLDTVRSRNYNDIGRALEQMVYYVKNPDNVNSIIDNRIVRKTQIILNIMDVVSKDVGKYTKKNLAELMQMPRPQTYDYRTTRIMYERNELNPTVLALTYAIQDIPYYINVLNNDMLIMNTERQLIDFIIDTNMKNTLTEEQIEQTKASLMKFPDKLNALSENVYTNAMNDTYPKSFTKNDIKQAKKYVKTLTEYRKEADKHKAQETLFNTNYTLLSDPKGRIELLRNMEKASLTPTNPESTDTGYLSPFVKVPIVVNNEKYSSVAHYAMTIRITSIPGVFGKIFKNEKLTFQKVKDDVGVITKNTDNILTRYFGYFKPIMNAVVFNNKITAVREKFTQNKELKRMLMGTSDQELKNAIKDPDHLNVLLYTKSYINKDKKVKFSDIKKEMPKVEDVKEAEYDFVKDKYKLIKYETPEIVLKSEREGLSKLDKELTKKEEIKSKIREKELQKLQKLIDEETVKRKGKGMPTLQKDDDEEKSDVVNIEDEKQDTTIKRRKPAPRKERKGPTVDNPFELNLDNPFALKPDDIQSLSPQYKPSSPEYVSSSPPFIVESPLYVSSSPEYRNPTSPLRIVPTSPQYNPSPTLSPNYNPVLSPDMSPDGMAPLALDPSMDPLALDAPKFDSEDIIEYIMENLDNNVMKHLDALLATYRKRASFFVGRKPTDKKLITSVHVCIIKPYDIFSKENVDEIKDRLLKNMFKSSKHTDEVAKAILTVMFILVESVIESNGQVNRELVSNELEKISNMSSPSITRDDVGVALLNLLHLIKYIDESSVVNAYIQSTLKMNVNTYDANSLQERIFGIFTLSADEKPNNRCKSFENCVDTFFGMAGENETVHKQLNFYLNNPIEKHVSFADVSKKNLKK